MNHARTRTLNLGGHLAITVLAAWTTLAEMGHGDEIVLADTHAPGHILNAQVLRPDGLCVTTLLDRILPLFEQDSYADSLVMMSALTGDSAAPTIHCPRLIGVA
jgi:L-fucose mutarotase/ribose pyranase (RbsD/FucU family)